MNPVCPTRLGKGMSVVVLDVHVPLASTAKTKHLPVRLSLLIRVLDPEPRMSVASVA